MHICLVSLDFKPFRSSGLTIYAEDLARGLTEAGHRVTVLAARRLNLPFHHWVEAIELYRVPIDRLDWISYSWRAAALLQVLQRSHSFDLVHFLDVHFAYAYHGQFVASIWQSFRQRLTAHQGGPYNTGSLDRLRRQVYYRTARRWMERVSLKRADRLIASCRSTKQEFISHYHVAADRIDMAVQGIDTQLFQPMPTEDLRRQLGLVGCRILLFVGFVTPRKGLAYLAQAMQLLPEDIHLLIVGVWGPGCRSRFVQALGKASCRVHEIGYIADELRPDYYSLADLYVSPSILEGLGITPIEALACQTPAVVTKATSGAEEVGESGVLVPPCDAKALAEAIMSLLSDPTRLTQLGQSGRDYVCRNFSYQRMTELTLQSYDRVVAERSFHQQRFKSGEVNVG